jgi:hypothetical protein
MIQTVLHSSTAIGMRSYPDSMSKSSDSTAGPVMGVHHLVVQCPAGQLFRQRPPHSQ